jgi:hypothetical protein
MQVKWIGDVTIVDAEMVAWTAPKKIWNRYVKLRERDYGTGKHKLLFAVCKDGNIQSVHGSYASAKRHAKTLATSS